ncbi:hypothetical protein C0Q70_12661 [Pomacea canaliculata]|uniref:Uncharacterized protein n=1 Tax=Pomacea canaliculata TaxID=400727 RepID=A0A2T7P263_POMCA|nr:hypothetical protein C0Q70_12661 [Pomacea canaliculata]
MPTCWDLWSGFLRETKKVARVYRRVSRTNSEEVKCGDTSQLCHNNCQLSFLDGSKRCEAVAGDAIVPLDQLVVCGRQLSDHLRHRRCRLVLESIDARQRQARIDGTFCERASDATGKAHISIMPLHTRWREGKVFSLCSPHNRRQE